jgi:Zn-dependent alcohol dehydrogenase
MKKFVFRGVVVLSLVGALGFAAVGTASAGSTSHRTSITLKTYRLELASYRAARAAIESTFRKSVAAAQSNYQQALAIAISAAERSAARQTMQAAIIQAASVRSASLVTLGAPPTPPATS